MKKQNIKKQKIKKLLRITKKKIKNFKPSKTFIAITSLLIGIGSTVLAQNLTKESPQKQYYLSSPAQDKNYHPPRPNHRNHDPFAHDFFQFHDDFGTSIFDEINQIQHHMDQIFEKHRRQMRHSFEKNFQHSQKHNSSISKKETRNSYIFEVKFNGFNKDEILVEIKDKTLNISAQNNQETKSPKQHQQSSSNFFYSFYLNELDQSKKPKIIRDKNKIIVTLSKE